MRLEGKVALISGAATGIEGELMGFGGASARLFAKEGAKVVLADIDVGRGEKTAAQIREDGWEALFVPLDVTKEQDWISAIGEHGFRPWRRKNGSEALFQRAGDTHSGDNAGGREKATSLLDESLAISSELGMRPLMERVLSRREILKA